LLEYIEKRLKRAKYKNDFEAYDEQTKADIEKMQADLYADWRKFKADPYWMVKAWNQQVVDQK
jgi:hypothetical protein